MVGTAVHGQQLAGMAVETDRGICPQDDRVDDFLPWTAMTGRAGIGPVGRNIVLNPVNLSPGRDNMTVAAGLSRRIEGQIPGG